MDIHCASWKKYHKLACAKHGLILFAYILIPCLALVHTHDSFHGDQEPLDLQTGSYSTEPVGVLVRQSIEGCMLSFVRCLPISLLEAHFLLLRNAVLVTNMAAVLASCWIPL